MTISMTAVAIFISLVEENPLVLPISAEKVLLNTLERSKDGRCIRQNDEDGVGRKRYHADNGKGCKGRVDVDGLGTTKLCLNSINDEGDDGTEEG